MRRSLALAIGGALLAAAAACTGNTTPVPISTPIAAPTITENYSGTLNVAGSNLHSFQVTNASEVDVTLLSLMTVAVVADPTQTPPVVGVPAVPVTIPLTLTVGQPTLTTLGVQCSNLKSVSAPPGPSPQLTGQALGGTYCVSISDPTSALPSAVTYAITVAHS
ncbi:MAG TPA: hypothetical protein VGY48_05660 [Vicinamibacterales bacterium]|jgi:hypothetical protein|nr:hypothetical protein [Vicinamibacterales bacterium]